MYGWLSRHVPANVALGLTAVSYGVLLVLLFVAWHHGSAEFRYLQL